MKIKRPLSLLTLSLLAVSAVIIGGCSLPSPETSPSAAMDGGRGPIAQYDFAALFTQRIIYYTDAQGFVWPRVMLAAPLEQSSRFPVAANQNYILVWRVMFGNSGPGRRYQWAVTQTREAAAPSQCSFFYDWYNRPAGWAQLIDCTVYTRNLVTGQVSYITVSDPSVYYAEWPKLSIPASD